MWKTLWIMWKPLVESGEPGEHNALEPESAKWIELVKSELEAVGWEIEKTVCLGRRFLIRPAC